MNSRSVEYHQDATPSIFQTYNKNLKQKKNEIKTAEFYLRKKGHQARHSKLGNTRSTISTANLIRSLVLAFYNVLFNNMMLLFILRNPQIMTEALIREAVIYSFHSQHSRCFPPHIKLLSN